MRRQRRCLLCGQAFASEGAHERVCAPCKETETWRSGRAATHGHIAW